MEPKNEAYSFSQTLTVDLLKVIFVFFSGKSSLNDMLASNFNLFKQTWANFK